MLVLKCPCINEEQASVNLYHNLPLHCRHNANAMKTAKRDVKLVRRNVVFQHSVPRQIPPLVECDCETKA